MLTIHASIASTFQCDNVNVLLSKYSIRNCLGPVYMEVGNPEVTRLGGVTRLST